MFKHEVRQSFDRYSEYGVSWCNRIAVHKIKIFGVTIFTWWNLVTAVYTDNDGYLSKR